MVVFFMNKKYIIQEKTMNIDMRNFRGKDFKMILRDVDCINL